MRIGVLSDLHCELEPTGSRWINPFEPEQLDRRTDAALAWFAEAAVDLIVILGDSVQFANLDDLEHIFARLATADVAPLATVNGNHDIRLDEFADCARAHRIRLLYDDPLELDGVAVTGVDVGRGPAPPQYVGRLGDWLGDGSGETGFLVVASHFPVLSEASRVASVGLPYAGDLVNRGELESALQADGRPKLVLSGHIHARCSARSGPLLQFTVGAVIEPPFDATLVEVEAASTTVRRTSNRLGEIAVTDPVFAADDERWRRVGDFWEPELPAAVA